MTAGIPRIETKPSLLRRGLEWSRPYRVFARQRFRETTWWARSLPHFVIIGAQKGGTSSLFRYLAQHPALRRSFTKEVHYFDGGLDPRVDTFALGPGWYRSHFPFESGSKTFEASPLYIFNPLAAQRIHAMLPKVKIIALLRNPTERAISHYFFNRRYDKETLPIEEALRREEARLADPLRDQDYKSGAFVHYSYKSRGLYKEQLERYLRLFPREQLLLIPSELFFSDTGFALKRIWEFIGVDAGHVVRNLTPRNVANNKSEVGPEVRKYLDAYFAPHNRALYGLVGEDYKW